MINKKILFAAWGAHNKNYTSYQSWYIPLRRIFKQFVSFDPQEGIQQLGREEMNRRFLEKVKIEKPDFIYFWLIYDEFLIDTLIKIREISPKTILVGFFGDDDTLFDNYSLYYSKFFDYILVFQGDYIKNYKEAGVKNVFLLSGATTSAFKPQKREKRYDVTFIGTPKNNRYELINYIYKKGINIRVFGSGWSSYPSLSSIYGGPLSQEDSVRIINESKINLSFTKNYLGKHHVKGRTFEIMACGSFVLSEDLRETSSLFKEDKEIVTFRSKDELLKKVIYYLENEEKREKIALTGYKKVIRYFSLDKQIGSIFSNILKKGKAAEFVPFSFHKNRVAYLYKSELYIDKNELKERLKNKDYVCFVGSDSQSLNHRELFQIMSLEKSGKDISCCDYYVHNKKLGNYLAFYSNFAQKILKHDEFNRLVSPFQLMVRKRYFFDHIQDFKKLFNGEKAEIINDLNTSFVTIPLVQIEKVPSRKIEKPERAFILHFETKIGSLKLKKRLFTDPYLYALLIHSMLYGEFVHKYIFNKAIRKLISKIKSSY